jgi:hypothetical protein
MSNLHGWNLDLLSTGTSGRFRRRYKESNCDVECVDHVIAPQDGESGDEGEAQRAKIGHTDEKSLPAVTEALDAHHSGGAVADAINVNQKRALGCGLVLGRTKSAAYVGPDEKHKLNHPTSGPVKRFAAGELAAHQAGKRVFNALGLHHGLGTLGV